MRKATINTENIILESIHQVALQGLENFTPKKVAVALGISEGIIYHYYSNKPELLKQCMLYILSQADSSLPVYPLIPAMHANLLTKSGSTIFSTMYLIRNKYISTRLITIHPILQPTRIRHTSIAFHFFKRLYCNVKLKNSYPLKSSGLIQ